MLEPESMAKSIEESLESAGFKPLHQKGAGHSYWVAVSEGIIKDIKSNAIVNVTGGSSSGSYKVT